jgi:hypothetical protein
MQSGTKHKQRGATFLGILTILAILGLALYAGIRLVPLYLDHFAVIKAMNEVAKSMEGGDASPGAIKTKLNARWTVDYISSVTPQDIQISPVEAGMQMHADYEARAPFVGNISFAVAFDDIVVINTRGVR